jgi:hypothetical protein
VNTESAELRPGPRLRFHPWTGVLLLAAISAAALGLGGATSRTEYLWLAMGLVAGFAVSGST